MSTKPVVEDMSWTVLARWGWRFLVLWFRDVNKTWRKDRNGKQTYSLAITCGTVKAIGSQLIPTNIGPNRGPSSSWAACSWPSWRLVIWAFSLDFQTLSILIAVKKKKDKANTTWDRLATSCERDCMIWFTSHVVQECNSKHILLCPLLS